MNNLPSAGRTSFLVSLFGGGRFRALHWTLLVYGLLCGIYWNYQQYFFLQPKPIAKEQSYSFEGKLAFEKSSLPFSKEMVIDVVKFQPKDSIAQGVVLFFHGNKNNVEHYSHYAPFITAAGYECWMVDYPGYGRSTGECTVENLQNIALQLYKMAAAKYPAEQITVYGKSLGTAVASYLAAAKPCRQLVLETPYNNLQTLAAGYTPFLPSGPLTKLDFDNAIFLQKTTAPVTVLTGNKDEVVPLQESLRLLACLKSKDAFYITEGGRHNNLTGFPQYKQVLDSLLQ